jgi:DivIVA domain-containing protein
MSSVLLVLVVVLVLTGLIFGIIALLSGEDPGLAPVEPDGRALPLPANRSLGEADLKAVKFDTAIRGYRMVQVDRALRRTAYDLGYKDEMIAVLEAEVIALREGRTEDADLLRKAREAASDTTQAGPAHGPMAVDEPPAPEAEPGHSQIGEPAAAEAGAEYAGAEPARAEPARAEPARAEPPVAEPLGSEPAEAEPAGTSTGAVNTETSTGAVNTETSTGAVNTETDPGEVGQPQDSPSHRGPAEDSAGAAAEPADAAQHTEADQPTEPVPPSEAPPPSDVPPPSEAESPAVESERSARA